MANKLTLIKEKLGSIPVLRKAMSIFMGPRDVIALDIGVQSMKLLYVKQDGAPELKFWGHVPFDFKPDASPEDKKTATINALKALLIQKGVTVKETATAISGNSVIVRYVKFPRLTKSELNAILATEAEPFIPFDINDVQLSFHILNEIVEEGQKKMETVLVAAKKDLVTARLEILQGAGLTPTIMDVDSFALENVYDHMAQKDNRPEAGSTLYLNIGHMVTNLSIIEGGVTKVVRDIFVSGNTFTKAIVKGMGVDAAKAEELKKTHGLITDPAEKEKALAEGNRDGLAVSQAISTVVKDLVAEVHRSVDFYLSQGPERSIGRIVLMGGSAALKNLAKHLTGELKVPVTVLDPFTLVKNPPADMPEALKASFGVAMGLALRSNKDWV
jgi:type IV pilus assembly protein PilM